MNVSAQVRYVDYAVRPLHSKNKRRPSEDSLAGRKSDPRPEDDSSEDKARQEPVAAFDDDDEGLGYSRQISRVSTTARKDMIQETVRPTPPLQGTAALLTLITTGDGRQHGVGDPVAAKPASRGDSFYDLLDQVIAQA